MKTRQSSSAPANVRAKVTELTAKVARARQRAAAARHQAESAKEEYKRARKAFKQAKKTAKEARKRLKASKKELRLAAQPAPKKAAKPAKKPEGANAAFRPSPGKKVKSSTVAKVLKVRGPAPSRKTAKPIAASVSVESIDPSAAPVIAADVTISSPSPAPELSDPILSEAPQS